MEGIKMLYSGKFLKLAPWNIVIKLDCRIVNEFNFKIYYVVKLSVLCIINTIYMRLLYTKIYIYIHQHFISTTNMIYKRKSLPISFRILRKISTKVFQWNYQYLSLPIQANNFVIVSLHGYEHGDAKRRENDSLHTYN